MSLLGAVGGLGVTFRQMFRRRVTTHYPEEKRPKPARFHGRHVLNRYEDGMEKCIGCELCAAVCPAGCIYVRGADNPPDAPVSPGERYGFVYEINYLRCIHCDLCVEACPTEAITETKLFELSFTNRDDAIYTRDELLVDDSGRARRLPWEHWMGWEDEETSGWVRATASSGDVDYEGRVAWSPELGFGSRAPERGQSAAGQSEPPASSEPPAVAESPAGSPGSGAMASPGAPTDPSPGGSTPPLSGSPAAAPDVGSAEAGDSSLHRGPGQPHGGAEAGGDVGASSTDLAGAGAEPDEPEGLLS